MLKRPFLTKNWILWKGSKMVLKSLITELYQGGSSVASITYFASILHGDNLWRIFCGELLCSIIVNKIVYHFYFFLLMLQVELLFAIRRKFFFVMDDLNLMYFLYIKYCNLITTTCQFWCSFFQLSYFFFLYMIINMYNSSKWRSAWTDLLVS